MASRISSSASARRSRWTRSKSAWPRSSALRASTAAASERCCEYARAGPRAARRARRRRGRARADHRALAGGARGARARTCCRAAPRAPGSRAAASRPRCASSSRRWRWARRASRCVLEPREPGPTGGDTVEFMIAPNPGVPAGPLREIASGGELSRVMLAIMSVAACLGGRCDARVRRGRRRHRRPHRTRRRRAAARAQRAPAGAVHHAPAADRLARRTALLDRQGHRAPSRRVPLSSSSARPTSSPSSFACSAPTPTTTPRAATRATSSAPPEASVRLAPLRRVRVTLAAMAATRLARAG